MEPGLDLHAGAVGDHDAAGLGLPPVVVEGLAEDLSLQTTASGFSGSPTRGEEISAPRNRIPPPPRAFPHHHADRGGRGIPDLHLLVLNRRVPAFEVELRLVDSIVTRFTRAR
jgi:hypothetical protein